MKKKVKYGIIAAASTTLIASIVVAVCNRKTKYIIFDKK